MFCGDRVGPPNILLLVVSMYCWSPLISQSSKYLLACWLMAGLASCSQQTQRQLPCPSVSVVSEASSATVFVSKEGRDLTDIEFEAGIDRVEHSCIYNRQMVTVNTLIRINSIRGPRSGITESALNFFVAVVDKEENILGRERFEAKLRYSEQEQRSAIVEEIEQIIPIRPNYRGLDYRILIGFELSPSQLQYNRDRLRRGTKRRLQ